MGREYEEGRTNGMAEQTMKGTAGVVPEDADPVVVADALVELAVLPRGKKPLRIFGDPANDGCDVVAPDVDRLGEDLYRRMGLEHLMKVSL